MEKQQLIALLEEGFQKPAWHGPNLRSTLRGVTAEEGLWRPARGCHNIWEIVVHAAYWKHTVTRRLTGSNKHDFPEKGRNWFVREGNRLKNSEATRRWKSDLKLLATTHQKLCRAITQFADSDLTSPMRRNHQTAIRNIAGIAMHDVYHAGQIQLIKKQFRDRKR